MKSENDLLPGQRELINAELDRSKVLTERAKEVQDLYQCYIQTGAEPEYEELFSLLERSMLPTVRSVLISNGCYSRQAEENAMQEARIGVWELLQKDRNSQTVRYSLLYSAQKICKNKGFDVVRKMLTERKHFDPISIDILDDDEAPENAWLLQELSRLEDETPRRERRSFACQMTLLYCRCLLDAKVFPPWSLSLFYARLLPHFLDAIPESKGSSAKWAYEEMGTRTVGQLAADAETGIADRLDQRMKWCSAFYDQLHAPIPKLETPERLELLVFTLAYTRKQLEDWAERMHKLVCDAASREIRKDPELREAAVSHIYRKSKIYHMIWEAER